MLFSSLCSNQQCDDRKPYNSAYEQVCVWEYMCKYYEALSSQDSWHIPDAKQQVKIHYCFFCFKGCTEGAWCEAGKHCEPAKCFLLKLVCSAYGSLQYLSVCCTSFIVGDFARRGVDISGVAWQQWGETPCACCVVCPTNGSRTVVLSDT